MHKGEQTTGGIAYFYAVETLPHKRVNRKFEKAGGHSVFRSPATQVPENPKAELHAQHTNSKSPDPTAIMKTIKSHGIKSNV